MRLYLNKAEVEHLKKLLSYGLKVDDNSPQMDTTLLERINACDELQGKHSYLTRLGGYQPKHDR